jgi:hypothetical protein
MYDNSTSDNNFPPPPPYTAVDTSTQGVAQNQQLNRTERKSLEPPKYEVVT